MQRGLVSLADLQCVRLSANSRLRSAWQRGVTSKPLQCVVLMARAARLRATAAIEASISALRAAANWRSRSALTRSTEAVARAFWRLANFCARSVWQRGVRERGDLQCVRLIARSHLRTAATRSTESVASAFW